MTGRLLKMRTELKDLVQYWLPIGEDTYFLNDLLGKKIGLQYNQEINCTICGRKTSKSFFQGMCYPCFTKAPQAEECVLRPELCRAHEGIARDLEYANNNCLQDHFVYISYTGTIKIGVTRESQIPIRWIDQGATQAIKLAKTPNRHLAGEIEVEAKKFMADKTNWRKMLTLTELSTNLQDTLLVTSEKLSKTFGEYILGNQEEVFINYPLTETPKKVKSVGFDKTPLIEGVLTGIKGQYLILDNERVLNIRKHGGYNITLLL